MQFSAKTEENWNACAKYGIIKAEQLTGEVAHMLRRIVSAMLALLLCLSILPDAQAAAAKTLTVSFEVTTYQNRARSLLKLINDYRKDNGADALVMLSDLEKLSLQRAAELFVFFDHDRPDLTGYDEAYESYKSLKGCMAVSECIAAGYSKADDVFADWEDSLSSTLLDPDFTHVGIACVYVKGSANEYYWEMYLQQQPEGISARKAESTAKAGTEKNMSVEIAKGMYAKADNSHRRFELRVEDLTLKTKTSAKPTVYLYDRYDVKIGKCELEDLTFKSSNTSVFTVNKDGTVKKKKNGTGTLTVKSSGLEDARCTVTIGSASSDSSVTASTIKDAKPELSAKEYSAHTNLSVYLKGASGYVLYRCTSKTGTYSKVAEDATTQRCTFKVEDEEVTRTYYYKVRAYKNSNGKRVYSEYSDPVRLAP